MNRRSRSTEILIHLVLLCSLFFSVFSYSDTLSPDQTKIYAENKATYVTMPDGVRIALEIYLPANTSDSSELPTIVSFTRYWRAASFQPDIAGKNKLFQAMNDEGYAVIIVDTRGSGASFGSRGTEFSTCETRDFKPVIKWISKRPWSNGKVATIGISYAGNTAENAIFDAPSALRAAIPRFTDFDFYTSILYPGGLANQVIFKKWGDLVRHLDGNVVPDKPVTGTKEQPKLLGVKPVDEDVDGVLLKQAILQHALNQGVKESFANANYRDDVAIAQNLNDDCNHTVSIYKFKKAEEHNHIPAFHWASWTDAGTAAGVLDRFSYYKVPAHYIIGPWSHGAKLDTNPFNHKNHPLEMSIKQQYQKIFAFLKPLMFEHKSSRPFKNQLDYYTMGENKWKTTYIWPPVNSEKQAWYLQKSNSLGSFADLPSQGKDVYKVNFNVGSGKNTRWTTQLGGTEVFYGDRKEQDKKLQVYTSAPLKQDIEITGTPILELFMSSTHKDGAIIAYLEMVDPLGKVSMLTEGELRLIHRKISTTKPVFESFGPYHSFLKKDGAPMVPGKVEKVSFSLLPTSVVIPEGYSIRLSLAGHDKDTFSRYPVEGDPIYSIYRSKNNPSKITLPVIKSDIVKRQK
ncbi:MAG TPA: CocE/NonD family hydrolase [Aeromonadales bacterium]|nr:CocE/NonD family hydrolase [Aeromonadales bacterium]